MYFCLFFCLHLRFSIRFDENIKSILQNLYKLHICPSIPIRVSSHTHTHSPYKQRLCHFVLSGAPRVLCCCCCIYAANGVCLSTPRTFLSLSWNRFCDCSIRTAGDFIKFGLFICCCCPIFCETNWGSESNENTFATRSEMFIYVDIVCCSNAATCFTNTAAARIHTENCTESLGHDVRCAAMELNDSNEFVLKPQVQVASELRTILLSVEPRSARLNNWAVGNRCSTTNLHSPKIDFYYSVFGQSNGTSKKKNEKWKLCYGKEKQKKKTNNRNCNC